MRVVFVFFVAVARRLTETVKHLGRVFATILTLSLVAIWGLFACILFESYTAELNAAKVFVDNVNALVGLDVARNLEFYDLSLKAAVAGYLDPEVRGLPAHLRHQILFDQSVNASGFGSLLILDATGKLVADSHSIIPRKLSAADRDYFQVHQTRPSSPLLFISHPFQSRLQPDIWAIGLSRRIDNPDGSFGGVALGTLKLSYLEHLFNTVQMPPKSTIAILHDDGTILTRMPFLDIGRDMSASPLFQLHASASPVTLASDATLDGVERLFAFRRVGNLPLRLIVGVPTTYFLATWRWRAALIGLGFIILSAFIVGLAITLGSEFHRRSLAEQRLSERAATDALTSLPNRRSFDDILDNEWARAIRDGTSVALVMTDCDFFKAYNDAYGHLQGDEGLRAIAGALRDAIQRPADFVARFGGEEFAILLPGTDLDGALIIAENVRAAVARLAWPHPRSPFGKLTVSLGVAACLPTTERDARSLVQAADFALYDAKEKGRNQTATGERLDLTAFGWRAAG